MKQNATGEKVNKTDWWMDDMAFFLFNSQLPLNCIPTIPSSLYFFFCFIHFCNDDDEMTIEKKPLRWNVCECSSNHVIENDFKNVIFTTKQNERHTRVLSISNCFQPTEYTHTRFNLKVLLKSIAKKKLSEAIQTTSSFYTLRRFLSWVIFSSKYNMREKKE